jgi:RNA polymerase sigma factor (sigma-70 family)
MYSIIEKHYKHNYKSLVKRVKFRAGSQEDAEDVMQEAYCRALKYADTFEMGTEYHKWFSRIISNVIKDHIAEKYGHSNNHEEMDEEHHESILVEEVDNDFSKILTDAIDKVENEEHKEVLSLYFTWGFSLREINQIVDFNYKNIETIIMRFKKDFKGTLK